MAEVCVGLVVRGVVDAGVGKSHAAPVDGQRRRTSVEPRAEFVGGGALRVVVHQVDQPLRQPQRRPSLGRGVRRRRRLRARRLGHRLTHAEDKQDDGQREHREAAAGAHHDVGHALRLQPVVLVLPRRLQRRPVPSDGRRRAGRRRPQDGVDGRRGGSR